MVTVTCAGGFLIGGTAPWAAAGGPNRITSLATDHHTNHGRVLMNNGNGKFNRTYATVLSPTVNRGLQQVANTNLSGRTETQVAFCKKKTRVCNIHQRLWDGW